MDNELLGVAKSRFKDVNPTAFCISVNFILDTKMWKSSLMLFDIALGNVFEVVLILCEIYKFT